MINSFAPSHMRASGPRVPRREMRVQVAQRQTLTQSN